MSLFVVFLILTGVVLAPGYTQMLTDKTLPEEVIGERPGLPGEEGLPAEKEVPAGETGEATESGYDYGSPVPPAAAAVNEDYFCDAVFIGDSRTRSFQTLSGPSTATYFTAIGLTVDTVQTKPLIKTEKGLVPVLDALRATQFQKVYLMLGINELGWVYSEVFIEHYQKIITEIKKIEPQAHIYIQSVLPVAATREDKIYNNERIKEYNTLLQQLARDNEVYYLNVAECVSDAEGALWEDASTDGVHLKKEYCDLWYEYLRLHYVP
ncbi:MAG: hypothetical protein GX357_01690 [Firmicutes bacterium]|nr:hypothetical protein [Bacillota bacterium]